MRKTQKPFCFALILVFFLQATFSSAAMAKSLRYGLIFTFKLENLLANQILMDEIAKTGVSRATQLAEQEMMIGWLRCLDRHRAYGPNNAKYFAEQAIRAAAGANNAKLSELVNQSHPQAGELSQKMIEAVTAEQKLFQRLVQEIFASGKLSNAIVVAANKNKIDVVIDRQALYVSPKGKNDFAYDLNLALAQELNVPAGQFPMPEEKPEAESLSIGFFDGSKVNTNVAGLSSLVLPIAKNKGLNLVVDSRGILLGNTNYRGTNLTNDMIAVAPALEQSREPELEAAARTANDFLVAGLLSTPSVSTAQASSAASSAESSQSSSDRKAAVAQASKNLLKDEIKECTAQLSQDPNNKQALLDRAFRFLALGDSAGAVKDAAQVLQASSSVSTDKDEYMQQLAVIALWLAYQKSGDSAAQKQLLAQAEAHCNRQSWPYPIIEFYANKKSWADVNPIYPQGKREAQFFAGMYEMCKSNFTAATKFFQDVPTVQDSSGGAPAYVNCLDLSRRMLEILGNDK